MPYAQFYSGWPYASPGHRQSARPRHAAPLAWLLQSPCRHFAALLPNPCRAPLRTCSLSAVRTVYTILNLKTRHGGTCHLYAALGHLRPHPRIFIGQLTPCPDPARAAQQSPAQNETIFRLFFLDSKPPRPSYCLPVKRKDLNSY